MYTSTVNAWDRMYQLYHISPLCAPSHAWLHETPEPATQNLPFQSPCRFGMIQQRVSLYSWVYIYISRFFIFRVYRTAQKCLRCAPLEDVVKVCLSQIWRGIVSQVLWKKGTEYWFHVRGFARNARIPYVDGRRRKGGWGGTFGKENTRKGEKKERELRMKRDTE